MSTLPTPILHIVGVTTTRRNPIPTVLIGWSLWSKVTRVAERFRGQELAGVLAPTNATADCPAMTLADAKGVASIS